MSFTELIQQIDEAPRQQRDRGTLFEHLIKAYLTIEPLYNQHFEEVWLLNEVPQDYYIPSIDTGVDLVALKRSDHSLVGIQAKFYDKDTKIYKRHIDSFLNEIGKNHYSEDKTKVISQELIANFNDEIKRLKGKPLSEKLANVNNNGTYIKWSRELKTELTKENELTFNEDYITIVSYRPFTKKHLYYAQYAVDYRRHYYLYPEDNLYLCIQGLGSKKPFSTLVTQNYPDLHFLNYGAQVFPLFKQESNNATLFNELAYNFNKIGAKIEVEDFFHYIYGILHSNEYHKRFDKELAKDFPRIPLVKDYNQVIEIGRQLIDLHIKYELVSSAECLEIKFSNSDPSYRVEKMKFGKGKDQSKIIYNKDIKIENIPERAYNYSLSGRSSIEWIMDQYRVKTDKSS